MFQTVKAEGLHCWAEAARWDHYGGVFFSLFGPRNSVRAAWAKFHAARGGGIKLGDDNFVRRAEGALYLSTSTTLKKGVLHMLIVRAEATNNSPTRDFLYQIDPEAQRKAFVRLRRACAVPMRGTWEQAIWELGQQPRKDTYLDPLVLALPGYGREVWKVNTTATDWSPIVTEAIKAGKLS